MEEAFGVECNITSIPYPYQAGSEKVLKIKKEKPVGAGRVNRTQMKSGFSLAVYFYSESSNDYVQTKLSLMI